VISTKRLTTFVSQWAHAFKRTTFVRFTRGFFFDGSTVKKAEPEVWKFISNNVREVEGACVDVGANRGEFTFLMAREMGETGIVYAFELHPENARLLQGNLWRYRHRIKVENLAVTDGKTELVGVFPGRNRSGAEWTIVGLREQEKPEFYARAVSLDKYFPPGKRIDLVKIDVEGAGQQVLVGMERILRESQPLIVFEVHNSSEWEELKHLEDAGYTLFDMEGRKLVDAGSFGFHCVAAPKGRQDLASWPLGFRQSAKRSCTASSNSSIAAVVITKDEERNIAACLGSLKWVDEVIVVDAESTDRTVELARAYTPKVFVRAWPGYGPQKNFAMDHATADWILIVDADERVSDELREEIQALLQKPGPAIAYRIPRRNFYYGCWIQGAGQYPDPQLRLVRRGYGKYDDLPVHEHLEVEGPIGDLRGHLDHLTHPTVVSHELKIERYSTLAAEDRIRHGKPEAAWYHLIVNPAWAFVKFYLFRRGYRDGLPGLIVSGFSAAYFLLKYAKLWERARTPSRTEWTTKVI
jgi:FkbM family methyltransferase